LLFMKYFFILLFSFFSFQTSFAQTLPRKSPCLSEEVYHQLDFWIGEWHVYNLKGKKSGDSKISLILDSCAILEEWTSITLPNGFVYRGKSMNTYDASLKQWQQNWTDNVGGNTHYVKGKFEGNKMVFETNPYQYAKDTMAIMRLTFFDLGPDKVRQFAQISKDNGNTWSTQYDLEYRRKKEE
ncbi:MAG TPA: hypothetical protein VLS85_07810, partial [Hanamia sp.]|nr:hypothetical protein [Hanamia sp.]